MVERRRPPVLLHRAGGPDGQTIGRVDGFQITRLWDEDRRTAEVFAHVFNDHPRVCDSLDQVSNEVDLVFIADCNFGGSDHVELASPGLAKGVPTFVDKPFGGTAANGRKLAELAQEHGAPICTGSTLTAMPATDQFESRFAEIGDVYHLSIEGCGNSTAGLIHAIALVIDEKALGPDRPDVAIDLNNLAGLYRATNMDDEAKPLEQHAASIEAIER